MTELLPCPCCGAKATYTETDNNKWLVECMGCILSASVPTHCKEYAQGFWNRRTPINKDQAIKDSLEQHNDKLRNEHG